MAAKQILNIVLGGRDYDVDARLLHQPIETVMIEWDR
jgi:hypothetical protein